LIESIKLLQNQSNPTNLEIHSLIDRIPDTPILKEIVYIGETVGLNTVVYIDNNTKIAVLSDNNTKTTDNNTKTTDEIIKSRLSLTFISDPYPSNTYPPLFDIKQILKSNSKEQLTVNLDNIINLLENKLAALPLADTTKHDTQFRELIKYQVAIKCNSLFKSLGGKKSRRTRKNRHIGRTNRKSKRREKKRNQ
jgi:hypothetical protein